MAEGSKGWDREGRNKCVMGNIGEEYPYFSQDLESFLTPLPQTIEMTYAS